jgi:hypothetical protein
MLPAMLGASKYMWLMSVYFVTFLLFLYLGFFLLRPRASSCMLTPVWETIVYSKTCHVTSQCSLTV